MSYHDPKSTADIDNRFGPRGAFHDLAHQLDREVPPGREKACALTKLEESMLWVDAADTRHAAAERARKLAAASGRYA